MFAWLLNFLVLSSFIKWRKHWTKNIKFSCDRWDPVYLIHCKKEWLVHIFWIYSCQPKILPDLKSFHTNVQCYETSHAKILCVLRIKVPYWGSTLIIDKHYHNKCVWELSPCIWTQNWMDPSFLLHLQSNDNHKHVHELGRTKEINTQTPQMKLKDNSLYKDHRLLVFIIIISASAFNIISWHSSQLVPRFCEVVCCSLWRIVGFWYGFRVWRCTGCWCGQKWFVGLNTGEMHSHITEIMNKWQFQ